MGKKFVADVMLKNIARWMRIFGVEVIYPETEDDDEILKLAEMENAVLLTMDIPLWRKCAKRGMECFLVPEGSAETQLVSIFKEFNIGIGEFESKTLCPKCNGKLKAVEKGQVKEKIPEKSFERHDKFWECKKCGKVYWEGSHWKKIGEMAEKIKEKSRS